MINDFDGGVLILEPFFWSNVIFKICFFCIKSHDCGREEFLWVPSPDCNTAELNASLYSCCLRFSKQEQTLYPGKPNNGKNFGDVNVTFEIEVANFENDIASEKRPYRIKTPSSKLMILVSSCRKKNFIHNNAHNLIILSLVFLK